MYDDLNGAERYNYWADKIWDIDVDIDDIKERIKKALNDDDVRILTNRLNELKLKREEYEEQQRNLTPF